MLPRWAGLFGQGINENIGEILQRLIALQCWRAANIRFAALSSSA
jgi:hypothetical protein